MRPLKCMKSAGYFVVLASVILMPNIITAEQRVVFSATDSGVYDFTTDSNKNIPFQILDICKERCKSVSYEPNIIIANGWKIMQVIPNQIKQLDLFENPNGNKSQITLNKIYNCKCYGNQYLIEK